MVAFLVRQLIELYQNKKRPVIIALCGAADVGKSTIAAAIIQKLQAREYQADHFSLDTFLLKREMRSSLGISGYQVEANDMKSAARNLANLIKDIPFNYFAYDHTRGENGSIGRSIRQPQILIIEGLHAFHPDIAAYLDYRIFINGSKEVLNSLRHLNNLNKRKMSALSAAENVQKEYTLYENNVLPYWEFADLVITVEEGWHYRL